MIERKIIAVAQRKGGVGKTTIAISVAAELRHRRNNVLLVDSDPQQSASQWAEPGCLKFPVHRLVLGDQPVGHWVKDVRHLASDRLVIDSAPNDRALGASIALSDLTLIPCTPSGLDIEATIRTLEIIDSVRARRPEPVNVILVPNRVDPRTLEGRQLYEELTAFGEPVAQAIGDRSVFVRAFSFGQSIDDFATGSQSHHEIQLLCDLVDRMLHRPS